MSNKISFEELVAKREQRAADKLKVGILSIPGGDTGLEARMPPQSVILELFGELAAANGVQEALDAGNHALYACCPQLQDRELQKALDVEEDPMSIIGTLFSLAEQDKLGGEAMRFLGLLPAEGQPADGKDPALETVKN